MVALSTARVLKTASGRTIFTHLETIDEVVEFWRTKYDAIFAQEARNRRLWATTARAGNAQAPGQVDAVIQARQIEWDEYVREQLEDISQGTWE